MHSSFRSRSSMLIAQISAVYYTHNFIDLNYIRKRVQTYLIEVGHLSLVVEPVKGDDSYTHSQNWQQSVDDCCVNVVGLHMDDSGWKLILWLLQMTLDVNQTNLLFPYKWWVSSDSRFSVKRVGIEHWPSSRLVNYSDCNLKVSNKRWCSKITIYFSWPGDNVQESKALTL